MDLVVPDKDKSLNEGAIEPWEPTSSDFYPTLLKRVCEVYKINMDKPYKKLTDRQKNILMHGSGDKEIEFTFTQRNGAHVNAKWYSKGLFLISIDATMSLLLSIPVK